MLRHTHNFLDHSCVGWRWHVAKRANGEGSIIHRPNGKYEVRVTVDGKRKTVGYFNTRKKASDKLNEANYNQAKGIPLYDDHQTFAHYLKVWLEMAATQIKESTLRKYRDDVRLRLAPHLGRTPLTKLSQIQIQQLYARLIKEGLAPKTVVNLHGTLHKALQDALQMDLVQRNVADLVKPPRIPHYQIRTLRPDEIRRLLDVVRGDRLEALYIIALSTGMREGELLGLRWQDVDLTNRVLYIRQGVQESDGPYILAEVKATYSRRNVALTDVGVAALHEHWERQLEHRSKLGPRYDDTLDPVFPNLYGGIMIPHNIAKRPFKEHLRAAGLSTAIRFHDLRHTAATLLLAAGVNVKVVSEMLGHSSVAITLRIYAHVLPHMQQTAVSYMDNLLGMPAQVEKRVV
jgi:integrase